MIQIIIFFNSQMYRLQTADRTSSQSSYEEQQLFPFILAEGIEKNIPKIINGHRLRIITTTIYGINRQVIPFKFLFTAHDHRDLLWREPLAKVPSDDSHESLIEKDVLFVK